MYTHFGVSPRVTNVTKWGEEIVDVFETGSLCGTCRYVYNNGKVVEVICYTGEIGFILLPEFAREGGCLYTNKDNNIDKILNNYLTEDEKNMIVNDAQLRMRAYDRYNRKIHKSRCLLL